MDLRNTYIQLEDSDHARAFQKHAFEIGLRWESGYDRKRVKAPRPIIIINQDLLIAQTFFKPKDLALKEILFENGVITFADDHIVDANKMVDFSDAKVGDSCFHFAHGEGSIVKFYDDLVDGLQVKIKCYGHILWCRADGKINKNDKNPSVFHSEPKIIIQPKPVRMKKINDHQIPDITLTTPDDGYAPDTTNPSGVMWINRLHTDTVKHLMDNNMLYPDTEEGEAAAIAHAKALLDYKED